MGFRFQRRITLAPGIRLNLSKRGLGLSVGPRGTSLSLGPSGVHGHAGIPGTGLSYRQKLNTRNRRVSGSNGGAGRSSPAATLDALLAQGETLPEERTDGKAMAEVVNSGTGVLARSSQPYLA
ncbi:DUF4236 domain-containing protein [Billgrantia antri]|uniref:DUF4236 domain-containing protein n=1 Tax=Halomonas sulfidivorans TaxID=2733488 RepID=A0ABX7WQV8_9GAMM|nr:DUF4236 domain-containing protein [Halomonas sulfidivorans]